LDATDGETEAGWGEAGEFAKGFDYAYFGCGDREWNLMKHQNR